MIREEMRVGPKGQVVIPHAIRKAMGVTSGSRVIFELRDDGWEDLDRVKEIERRRL